MDLVQNLFNSQINVLKNNKLFLASLKSSILMCILLFSKAQVTVHHTSTSEYSIFIWKDFSLFHIHTYTSDTPPKIKELKVYASRTESLKKNNFNNGSRLDGD